MFFALSIIIVAIIVWNYVKIFNNIVELHSYVERSKSNVNAALNSYKNKLFVAVSIAERELKLQTGQLRSFFDEHGVNTSSLRLLGNLYPDIKPQLGPAINLVESTFNEYYNAQKVLNEDIRKYNAYICKFPNNFAVWFTSYDIESHIDHTNLEDSKVLYRDGQLDFSHMND